MSDLIKSFIAGIIGVFLQMLYHYIDLRNLAKKSNTYLSFGEYVKEDWINSVISTLTICVALLAWDSYAHLPAWVMNNIIWVFCFVGFVGAEMLSKVFGAARKRLYDLIDRKTNVADNILPDITLAGTGRPDDRQPNPPPPKP